MLKGKLIEGKLWTGLIPYIHNCPAKQPGVNTAVLTFDFDKELTVGHHIHSCIIK